MENSNVSVMESDRTPAINVQKKITSSVDVLEQALKEAEEYETNTYVNPHALNLQDHGIHISDHPYVNISNSSSVNFNMDSRDNDQANYADGISEKFDVQTSNSNSNDLTGKATQSQSCSKFPVNTSSTTNSPCIIPLKTANSSRDTFSDDNIINNSEPMVPSSRKHITDSTVNIPESQFLQHGNDSLLPTVTTDISETFQTYSSSSQYVLKLFGNDTSDSISSNSLLAEMTDSSNLGYLIKTEGLVSTSLQGSNRNMNTIINSSSMKATATKNPKYTCKLKDNVLPLTIHEPICNISSDTNMSNSLSNVERIKSANPQYFFKLKSNPANDVLSSTASTVTNTVSENTNIMFQLKDTTPKINLLTENMSSISNASSRPSILEKTISAVPQYILKISGNNNSMLVPTVDASNSSSTVEKKFNSQYALTFSDNILSSKLDASTDNLAITNPSPNTSTVKNTAKNSQYVVKMKDSLVMTPTVDVTTKKAFASSKSLPSTKTSSSSSSRMYKLSEDVLSLISEASSTNPFTVNTPSSHTTVDKTINPSNSNVSLFNISSNPVTRTNTASPQCILKLNNNESTPAVGMSNDVMSQLKLSPRKVEAPLGSAKNPIQIIHHGNSYHSTQVLSQAHLQQISHVLQDQKIPKDGKSVLYDPSTNTRIICKVICTKEKETPSEKPHSNLNAHKSFLEKVLGKKWKKHTSSKEEREEKKKQRPRTRSGRISKPPSYMVKDYKRIHHLDFEEEAADDSDGGYSDYHVSDEDQPTKTNLPPGVSTSKRRNFSCHSCNKAYIGKGGLYRHYKLYPSHNHGLDADVSTQDENSNSSLASSVLSSSGIVNSSVSQDAPAGFDNDCSDPSKEKRKSQLRKILKNFSIEELVQVVLPQIAPSLSLWDFLLAKCDGKPEGPQLFEMLKDLEDLLNQTQKTSGNTLINTSSKQIAAAAPSTEQGTDDTKKSFASSVEQGMKRKRLNDNLPDHILSEFSASECQDQEFLSNSTTVTASSLSGGCLTADTPVQSLSAAETTSSSMTFSSS